VGAIFPCNRGTLSQRERRRVWCAGERKREERREKEEEVKENIRKGERIEKRREAKRREEG
jgi:hypothetical protein